MRIMRINQNSRMKLRRAVKDFLKRLEREQNIPNEFQPMIDKNNSLAFRLFWTLLVIVCILIYCYQMYDRISYYLDNPKAVDVYEEKLETYKFPKIHMCTRLNKYVMDYNKPYAQLLTDPDGDLTKLWNLNYSFDFDRSVFAYDTRRHPKVHVPLNITIKPQLYPMGSCTEIEVGRTLSGSEINTKFNLHLQIPELWPGKEPAQVGLALPLDFQFTIPSSSDITVNAGLQIRTHQFVNTRKEPCVKMKNYIECGKKCTESILDKNPCWLPYRPRYSKGKLLELCNNSEETVTMWTVNRRSIMGPTPQVDCNCIRSCEVIDFNPRLEFEHADKDKPGFVLYVHGNHATVLRERFIYELISLLSDFGGNLGLWLGLSSLSVINLVFVVANWNMVKLTNRNIHLTRRIEACLKINRLNITKKKNKLSRNQILYFLLYICLFAFSGFLVGKKISLYLNKEIQMTVSIEDPANVTFPNIIVCGGAHNPTLLEYKAEYFVERKQNNTKYHVDILDLVNWNNFTVNELWNLTYVEPLPQSVIAAFNPFPDKLSHVQTHTSLPNPQGTCIKYSFGSIKFHLFTMFYYGIIEESDNLFKPDLTHVYFTSNEDPNFSYNLNSAAPSDMATSALIRRLNIHRLNTKTKPCNANLTEYYKCKGRCLENKIKTKQLCSMPFAIKENVAFCNSSATAKAVQTLYYEIQTKIDVEKQCLCVPPCKQPLYKINDFSLPASHLLLISALFPSNKIEIIAEEFKYTFVALISDIANIFSLTLGLSVLTAIRFICSLVLVKIRKIRKQI